MAKNGQGGKQGEIKALADVRPQAVNANRGTQRGRGMLERSVDRVGVLGALTVAADGETFDGSKRLEVFGDAFGPDVEPIIVHSDGTRPVIHVRDDIPNASDPRAVEAGLLANRVAAVSLDWDADVLAAIAGAGDVDLSALWRDEELAEVLRTATDVEPPADFATYDESIDTEHECPRCHYRWSGGA